jgi:hypothetical protein
VVRQFYCNFNATNFTRHLGGIFMKFNIFISFVNFETTKIGPFLC